MPAQINNPGQPVSPEQLRVFRVDYRPLSGPAECQQRFAEFEPVAL